MGAKEIQRRAVFDFGQLQLSFLESQQGAERFSDSSMKVSVNLVKSDSLRLAARWQQVFGLRGGSDMGMGPNLSPSPLPGCFESQVKQALLLLFLFLFFFFQFRMGESSHRLRKSPIARILTGGGNQTGSINFIYTFHRGLLKPSLGASWVGAVGDSTF